LDADVLGHFAVVNLLDEIPHLRMHFLGNLGVADKPGANGPDGLIRNCHVLHLLFADALERLGNLCGSYISETDGAVQNIFF